MNFPENANYEFNQDENQLISKLSSMMKYVGIIFCIIGVVSIVVSISNLQTYTIIQGMVEIIIGYSLINAAISFKKIVDTQGNDISNLMNALKQLFIASTIQFWSLIAVFVFVILLTIFIG